MTACDQEYLWVILSHHSKNSSRLICKGKEKNYSWLYANSQHNATKKVKFAKENTTLRLSILQLMLSCHGSSIKLHQIPHSSTVLYAVWLILKVYSEKNISIFFPLEVLQVYQHRHILFCLLLHQKTVKIQHSPTFNLVLCIIRAILFKNTRTLMQN